MANASAQVSQDLVPVPEKKSKKKTEATVTDRPVIPLGAKPTPPLIKNLPPKGMYPDVYQKQGVERAVRQQDINERRQLAKGKTLSNPLRAKEQVQQSVEVKDGVNKKVAPVISTQQGASQRAIQVNPANRPGRDEIMYASYVKQAQIKENAQRKTTESQQTIPQTSQKAQQKPGLLSRVQAALAKVVEKTFTAVKNLVSAPDKRNVEPKTESVNNDTTARKAAQKASTAAERKIGVPTPSASKESQNASNTLVKQQAKGQAQKPGINQAGEAYKKPTDIKEDVSKKLQAAHPGPRDGQPLVKVQLDRIPMKIPGKFASQGQDFYQQQGAARAVPQKDINEQRAIGVKNITQQKAQEQKPEMAKGKDNAQGKGQSKSGGKKEGETDYKERFQEIKSQNVREKKSLVPGLEVNTHGDVLSNYGQNYKNNLRELRKELSARSKEKAEQKVQQNPKQKQQKVNVNRPGR